MDVIGIIPSADRTFEICGDFNSKELVEGKLYYDSNTKVVYYYSSKETRSSPTTGYFPVWDGKKTYVTSFSKIRNFDTDVTKVDLQSMSSAISKDIADQIIYQHRKCDNSDVLNPAISDGDNMFTQCIKGVIKSKQITMVDLIDMAKPKLPDRIVENYYSALTKITFMRYEKWNIWVDSILHLTYTIDVYRDKKKLVSYEYPSNKFDTGIVKYDNIINTKDDQFKKIIKILTVMENINKSSLRSEDVDDYTINNMMTTLSSDKPLSAQLFSRFIRMAKLSYVIKIYDKTGFIFEYKE